MRRTRLVALVALVVLAGGPLAAQQPGPRPGQAPLFPVEAHIVSIDVVAADSDERPVRDLGLEDFEVYEAGRRQAIVLFMAPADRPAARAVSILIDDVGISPRQLRQARDVARRLAEQATAGDRVRLRAPASGVEAWLEAPFARGALSAQLARVAAHPDLVAALGEPELARRLNWGRVEAMAAALEALDRHSGPRALVVIGTSLPYRADGAFGAAAYERLMRASERAAAPVYFFRLDEDDGAAAAPPGPPDWVTGKGTAIGVAPLLPMPRGETARAAGALLLDAAAADAGGFTAATPAGWSWAIDRILAARAYYLLGFPSEPASWDGAYHPIEIRVRREGVRLVARRGYFAPNPPTAPAP